MFNLPANRRDKIRFYARIDDNNYCETVWAAASAPTTGRWVEVTGLNPLWIGKPLPRSARCNEKEAGQ